MKRLLQILGIGFVVFQALAIVEEWNFFASAWFGSESAETELSEEDRSGAMAAVRMTLELSRHLYSSRGDERFAERMPVSERIVEQLMKEIDYLANNHRRQEMRLDDLEIVDVTALDEDRVEVRTRETWLTHLLWLDGLPAGETRRDLVHAKYLVVESAQGWRVEAWDFDPEREDEEAVEA